MTPLDAEALIAAAEKALHFESPWSAVRKIAMSEGRFAQLQALTPRDTDSRANHFASIDIEVWRLCDDRIAVLIDRNGELIGIYSFQTGGVHWFDRGLLRRFTEPRFQFQDDEPVTVIGRYSFGLDLSKRPKRPPEGWT